jgi:hypothetical protein
MISTSRANSAAAVGAEACGAGRRSAGDGSSGMASRYASITVMSSDQPGVTFTAFVMSLATTAAVHFGDIADPVSGTSQANLPAASQMIDILAMLQEKTRGNLSPEETELVANLLYELRMRFIEASQSEKRIITP